MNFLKACAGLSMVILATAVLIFSVKFNPLKADAPSANAATGKIMMDQCVIQGTKDWYYQILVWDTDTGKSKSYYYSKNSKQFLKDNAQLPSSPLY